MARRAPKDEKPYNPIESALIQRVAAPPTPVPASEEKGQQAGAAAAPALSLIETSAREEVMTQPSLSDLSKKGGREKRVILSWEDEQAVEELLRELSQDLRTPVKLSNALRSCVMLLRHSQDNIRKNAKQTSALARPPNNDQTAIAYFEHRLAKLFQAGIRGSQPIE